MHTHNYSSWMHRSVEVELRTVCTYCMLIRSFWPPSPLSSLASKVWVPARRWKRLQNSEAAIAAPSATHHDSSINFLPLPVFMFAPAFHCTTLCLCMYACMYIWEILTFENFLLTSMPMNIAQCSASCFDPFQVSTCRWRSLQLT